MPCAVFARGGIPQNRIPPSVVIVRQRSPPRSGGLPTKDLCTSSHINSRYGVAQHWRVAGIWVAQCFSAAMSSLVSICSIAESHTVRLQATQFLAAFARKPALFCRSPERSRRGSRRVEFHNRTLFKSCHSERGASLGGRQAVASWMEHKYNLNTGPAHE